MHSGHVFISYSRKDGARHCDAIQCALKRERISTWYDTRHIDASQDFTSELERAIKSAAVVVVCITPDAIRDNSYVRREVSYALLQHKPVLVARIADVVPPISIVNHTWVDFFQDSNKGVIQLCSLIRKQDYADSYTNANKATDTFSQYLTVLYNEILSYLDGVRVLGDDSGVRPLLSLKLRQETAHDLSMPLSILPQAFFEMAGIGSSPHDSSITINVLLDNYKAMRMPTVLHGAAGSGKTTLLMAFAREAVGQRLSDIHYPLPIIAPIATWTPDKHTSLAQWIGELFPSLRGAIDGLITRGEALLILDGLDELGSERKDATTGIIYDPRLRFLHMACNTKNAIVSCRTRDLISAGLIHIVGTCLQVQPIDDGELQSYLQNSPVLLQKIKEDDNIREMARTPLILRLLAYGFSSLTAPNLTEGRVGELRGKIFKRYVEQRYEHEARKLHVKPPFTLREVNSVLERVALYQCAYVTVHGASIKAYLSDRRARTFKTFVEQLHLVRPERSYTPKFMHELLRDYFAFNRAVRLLVFPSEGRESIDGEMILPAHQLTAIRALGTVGDLRVIPFLMPVLADMREWARDAQICEIAEEALRKIGRRDQTGAMEYFSRGIENSDANIRAQVARLLSEFHDERVIPLISKLLHDQELTFWGTPVSVWAHNALQKAQMNS